MIGRVRSTAPPVPGARVTGITGTERRDHGVPPGPFNPEPIPIPDICEVVLTLTRPGADDTVTVEGWLPVGWNGRFQGTGGGGFVAGFLDSGLAPAITSGYTDACVGEDTSDGGDWFLAPNGDELLENFASRSPHDLAVAGKALTPGSTAGSDPSFDTPTIGDRDFHRLFLAPGAGHRWGGNGPVPARRAGRLGRARRGAGHAGGGTPTATRNLCRYPLVSRYDGHGDPDQASSFRCARSY